MAFLKKENEGSRIDFSSGAQRSIYLFQEAKGTKYAQILVFSGKIVILLKKGAKT